MKKLFLTGILVSALFNISAFAFSSAVSVYNFTCPAVENIEFTKIDNGNDSMTIYAKAASTVGMPQDIGYWIGAQNYVTTNITGEPVLQNELSDLPYGPTCVYTLPATPYNLSFDIVPSNGDNILNYLYSGTALAIKAIKK